MKRALLVAFAFLSMSVPVSAASTDCNAVVSMSQGRQMYYGSQFQGGSPSELEVLTGEQWMALIMGGKVLSWWTDASHWDFLDEWDRCGTDVEIDSVIFIFDPFGSGRCGSQGCDDGTIMRNHLTQVLDITAARYPNADTWLTMLVGSVGHVVCVVAANPVRASRTHRDRIGQLTLPEAGPDLDVPCFQYADNVGHLTDDGAANAQGQLAAWFNLLISGLQNRGTNRGF